MVILVNWLIWIIADHVFFYFFGQDFVAFVLDKSEDEFVESLKTVLLVLFEHLVVLLTSGARLLATGVCGLYFVHVSDHIHARTELIYNQITELIKFIVIDKLLDFLHSLFKLFDFLTHLLTLTNP